MVLLPNLLYCTANFANFKGILGFSAPSARPTKTELRASSLAKEITMVSGISADGRRQTLLYSCR